jgi:hypothetical protein
MCLSAQPPTAGGAQAPTQAQGIAPVTQAVSTVQSAAADAHPHHSRGVPPHTAQKPEDGKPRKEASNVLNEWTARISYNKNELGGSCFMLIFLGEVPEDPLQWRKSRSLVGLHYASECAVIQYDNRRNQVAGGFVHLNWAIAERSGLSSPSFEHGCSLFEG